MIRADRELLAELARLNTDMASLGMRIMAGSASGTEQRHYAQRLISAGEQLWRRANEMDHPVIESEVLPMYYLLCLHVPWSPSGSREQCAGGTVLDRRDNQLAFSTRFVDMAEHIHDRAPRTP